MPLANETDAFAIAPVAQRTRFDGYTLVEVPARRDFYFGNMLELDREPDSADLPRWLALHANHFAGTDVRRHALVWERDSVRDVAPALAIDPACEFTRTIVFVRRTPFADRSSPDARVRTLATDADWALAAELDAAEYEPAFGAFARWRFGLARESARAGRLRMSGFWDAGRLMAVAGIYTGDGIARLATPVTHPDHRRRGAFRALCGAIVDDALRRAPSVPVTICAAAGEPPEAIYRHLGFEAVGEQFRLACPLRATVADRLYS